MSQDQTIAGVGRLFRGQRTLGCVGYRMEIAVDGQVTILEFDPVPDGREGDVFSLSLADGRILECEAGEHCRRLQVRGEGLHIERRVNRRPSALSRLLV